MRRTTKSDSDSSSIDELINTALNATDEETAWGAVVELHGRGSREVYEKALGLTRSHVSEERSLGADILGQLGKGEEGGEHSFPQEAGEVLLAMLASEEDPEVLEAVLTALSYLHDPKSIPEVARFVKHEDPEVRHTAVLALMGHDDQTAIDLLIGLSVDEDPEVRDWATFALGTQLDADTPEIRAALAERLQDPDEVIRGEALVGLARRRDDRVVPALKQELRAETVEELVVGAAELTGSPELHALLVALSDRWDGDPEILELAITACDPSNDDS